MMHRQWTVIATGLIAVFAVAARAQEADQPVARAAEARASITVAVLDFESLSAGDKNLGRTISDTLTAVLSAEDGFSLVERSNIEKVLREQELGLSGLVDAPQAARIGRLVGARIMVVGQVFQLGDSVMITAKLIGTETTLVKAVVVQGELKADLAKLTMALAQKAALTLRQSGPALIASPDAADPLPQIKAALKDKILPTVAVVIPERHIGAARPTTAAPDPAAETEIKLLLRDAGFTVIDVQQNDLADWIAREDHKNVETWPRSLHRADVVIIGEGFSEFGARIGNLVSCPARLEVNVIDRKSGQIDVADRTTARGVDLAENIAGKTALEKAGRELGLRILKHFADTLPVAEAKPVDAAAAM